MNGPAKILWRLCTWRALRPVQFQLIAPVVGDGKPGRRSNLHNRSGRGGDGHHALAVREGSEQKSIGPAMTHVICDCRAAERQAIGRREISARSREKHGRDRAGINPVRDNGHRRIPRTDAVFLIDDGDEKIARRAHTIRREG